MMFFQKSDRKEYSDLTNNKHIVRGTITFGASYQVEDVIFASPLPSIPTVVASFVGAKNDVRAQVANSDIYIADITATSFKAYIDRSASTAAVVVQYIAICDGIVKNV